jgi:hypothetical protein
MCSVAAARRTQSSYPSFLAETNASDLTMSTYGVVGGATANNYSPKLTSEIARLPEVKRAEAWVGAGVLPLKTDGAPILSDALNAVGSVNGLYFDEDRATPIAGRMADPTRADEFVTTALGAREMGLHVGDVVPMGVYSTSQFNDPGFGTAEVHPTLRLNMHLVGLVIFNTQVIEDDADQLPTDVLFTPALTRRLIAFDAVFGTWYAMQLAGGDQHPSTTEAALIDLLPSGSDPNFSLTAVAETKVERSVKPESIALGVFGAIAALAILAIAALAISRQLRSSEEELQALRALGASPWTNVADGLIGVLVAVVIGGLLVAAVAVSLSPLAPLGPMRQVFHPPGIAFDWTVLGVGLMVLIAGLGAIATALAYRGAPHRLAARSLARVPRQSKLVQLAAATGLPVSPPSVSASHLPPGASGPLFRPARSLSARPWPS